MASRREKKQNKPVKSKLSEQAQADAQTISEQVSKPGFTKQQRKEVHQAIQQGIERYKQQHSAKARSVDKQRKKRVKQAAGAEVVEQALPSPSKWPVIIPWLLLAVSWCCFATVYVVTQ